MTVTLLGAGVPGGLRQVTISRGTIPLPSVDVAYMVNKETGYIRINRFSATTHAEFAQAVMKLQQQGLQRMILDLRENGGGDLTGVHRYCRRFPRRRQVDRLYRRRPFAQSRLSLPDGMACSKKASWSC